MRLAVIGAGPAGLATLRALTARGFDAVAFERRPCIGGVWALHDDERPTAAYRSLHLITSRDRTEYAEHPMPDGTPDYPSRDAVGRYLEAYAEKFGLRLAVVGAGPAGLAALRALTARGFDAVAFERRPCVGGVWTLDDERPTAAYRSLHLITSRARTEFAELPMPDGHAGLPEPRRGRPLPRGLRRALRAARAHPPGRRVSRARARSDGAAGSSSSRAARASASTCSSSRTATTRRRSGPTRRIPGEFDGRQLHALDYAEADEFRGQNVLVVGMGNSAMDIATDISHVADRTYLSARHGSWVIPKRLLGRPADQIIKPWVAVHVPWRIRQPLSQFLLRLTVGPPERYGLPAPSRGLFQDHPTITDTVLSRISHGELTPKPGIAALAPRRRSRSRTAARSRSTRSSGARATASRCRSSTQALTGPDPKELPLYKRIFHLDCPDLFFVGLMQSTGSAFPIVERQAQLLAEHLAGDWRLPPAAEQRRDCERRRRYALARWGEHGRPAMRVDFDRFMHELGQRARARARAGGRVSRRALVTGASGAFGTRASRRAEQPRLGRGRARPEGRRRRGDRLRRDRRRRGAARGRRGRAAARRRSTCS